MKIYKLNSLLLFRFVAYKRLVEDVGIVQFDAMRVDR